MFELLLTPTSMVQVALAGMMPPDSETISELSTPLVVPVQPAVTLAAVNKFVALVGLATFNLLSGRSGKLSVNAAPVIATLLGFVMVMRNMLTASFATGLVKNVLVTVGGLNTVKFAVLLTALAVGVCVVATPLAVLGNIPGVLLVIDTITVQPPAGKLGTVKFNAAAPTASAGELVTPVQVPPMVAEAAVMLVSVSVKLALVSATPFVFPNVNVIVLVPPGPMVVGLKALTIVGLLTTVRLTGPAPAPAPICVVVTPETLFGLLPRLVLVT